MRNQLVRITFPDGAIEKRAYDANGNVTRIVDRDGGVTSYQYDALGRLIVEAIAPGRSAAALKV